MRDEVDDETIQLMEDAIRDQEKLLVKLKTQQSAKDKIASIKARTAAIVLQFSEEGQTVKRLALKVK